jgi:hypothetical protein
MTEDWEYVLGDNSIWLATWLAARPTQEKKDLYAACVRAARAQDAEAYAKAREAFLAKKDTAP